MATIDIDQIGVWETAERRAAQGRRMIARGLVAAVIPGLHITPSHRPRLNWIRG